MDATFFDNLARLALSQSPYPDPRFPPSPYYRFLKLLAGAIYPSLSVELGVCGGGGSFYLAQGWRPGQVVGVDCTIEYPQNIDFILTIMHNFTFYKGDSVDSVENIVATYGKPNIVFIDTIHTFERTVQEFEAWKPYLAEKAVVCFDDLNRKEMSGFWEYVPRGNKVRLDRFWEEMPEPKYLSKEGLHREIPMGFVIVNQKEEKNVATDREPNPVKPTTPTKRGRPRKES